MFSNEQDEYCIRSRGTNVFKSPEMLANYGYQVRKDADNFDRRKKLGTIRASDIWSLGCLFYELLTGKFLFPEIDEDYFGFTMKLNSQPFSEIFTEEKKKELNYNTYLIDLLLFLMVCDQKYRPNIDKIIERFDHVHAILVNSNTYNNPSIDYNKNYVNNNLNYTSNFNFNNKLFMHGIDSCNNLIGNNLDIILEAMQEMFIVNNNNNLNNNFYFNNTLNPNKNYTNNQNKKEYLNEKVNLSNKNIINKNINNLNNLVKINNNNNINSLNIDNYRNEYNLCNNSNLIGKNNIKFSPCLFKITKDIYLLDYNFFETEIENTPNKISQLGITHIISWKKSNNKYITEKVEYLNLMETTADLKKPVFYHIFKVLDFLRYCMIHQGIICFIDDFQFSNIQEKPNFLIRSIIILCFSYMMKLPAYDAWTYINTKLLFFNLPIENLVDLSCWINNQITVEYYLSSYPSFRCLCGACVIYIRNQLNSSNCKIIFCSCSEKYDNFDNTKCPSNGCYDYIHDMKVILIMFYLI